MKRTLLNATVPFFYMIALGATQDSLLLPIAHKSMKKM